MNYSFTSTDSFINYIRAVGKTFLRLNRPYDVVDFIVYSAGFMAVTFALKMAS